MLLNYLYQNYYETSEFCKAAGLEIAELKPLEDLRLVPKASYKLGVELSAESFVADYDEQAEYNFYLKGQLEWLAQVKDKQITAENAARHYFDSQYNVAIDRFLVSDLGVEICKIYPQNQWHLSDYGETWQHFLNGTYGLCTRTGLPNEIFLKHIYIRFIEFVTAANLPDEISNGLRVLLLAVVDDLDQNVESNFAAHEVAKSSRQRCIIDVRDKYQN